MAFVAYVDRSRVDSLIAGAKRAIAASKQLHERATAALDESMQLVRDHEAGRRDDGGVQAPPPPTRFSSVIGYARE